MDEEITALAQMLGHVEDGGLEALRALCQKVTPDSMEGFEAAVEQSLNVTAVWKVHMEELSGKAKRER